MRESVLACVLLATTSLVAHADVLLLDTITAAPPNSTNGVPRPRGGSSMAQVRAQYGEPTEVRGPVGDPPITRWIYPGYTAYFEHEHVIDVVVHR